MSKSIKLKDNNYLDSKSVVHNKQLLSDIVDKLNNSMNKNGTAIRKYLEKNKPDQSDLVWTEKNGYSLCTVSAGDYTANELNHFMRKLFGKSESFVSVQPQQRTGIFAAASDWSELIDVSDFSYNNNDGALMRTAKARKESDAAFRSPHAPEYVTKLGLV